MLPNRTRLLAAYPSHLQSRMEFSGTRTMRAGWIGIDSAVFELLCRCLAVSLSGPPGSPIALSSGRRLQLSKLLIVPHRRTIFGEGS